jgi:hypothetical protein
VACRPAEMPGAGPMIPMCDDEEDRARVLSVSAWPGGRAGGYPVTWPMRSGR